MNHLNESFKLNSNKQTSSDANNQPARSSVQARFEYAYGLNINNKNWFFRVCSNVWSG